MHIDINENSILMCGDFNGHIGEQDEGLDFDQYTRGIWYMVELTMKKKI